MRKGISNHILKYMGNTIRSTTDIENYGMSIGYSQRQVLGGIGYLRRKGLIDIVSSVVNTFTGRKEHLFK